MLVTIQNCSFLRMNRIRAGTGAPSPPSGLRGFIPVVRDRWEQGRFGWGRPAPERIQGCSAARPPLPPPPGIPPPPCGFLWCGFPPAPPHCGCGRLPPPLCGSLWCGFPPAPPHCGCGRLRPLPWLLLVGCLASGC